MIKLVSLNVERSKHLKRVLPFLEQTQADVVCLMEVMERDLELFKKAVGPYGEFVAMTMHPAEGDPGVMGIVILSRLPIQKTSVKYYAGSQDKIPDFETITAEGKHANNHMLLVCEIEKEGSNYAVATTHFTWTPTGDATDPGQRRDVLELLSALKECDEFVLTGDFNATRGGEIFSQIAAVYKDNVPQKYTTSIDGMFHRAGQLPYMVDGLFSTPHYALSNVEMVCGLSDHCGFTASVSKS